MMKKTYLMLLLLLPAFYAGAQKVQLQLNLTKGVTYQYITKNSTNLVQTIKGQTVDIDMTIAGKMSFTVVTVRDSLYDMSVKYDSLSIKMDLPTGEMFFSSEKTGDMLSEVMAKLKTRPFAMIMAKTGRVVSITGLEALFEEFINTMPGDEKAKAQAKSQLLQSFGEKSLKGSMEGYTYLYPAQKVGKNDRWAIDTEVKTTVSMKVHTLFTLNDITATNYIISGLSTISTAEGDEAPLNGMPVKYSIAGTANSTIKTDKKTGWVTQSQQTIALKGNIEIKDNDKLLGGLMIPMSLIGTTIITDK